jgi:opacity protein-like surface antigen
LPDPVFFGFNNTSLAARSTGVIGGAQAGYNWQIGSLVTGPEADIQGSGIKGSANAVPTSSVGDPIPVGTLISSEPKLSWFGAVRGRLGVTVTPDLLLYGTGGLAYGRVAASANVFLPSSGVEPSAQAPASISKTKAGWRRAPAPHGCSRTIGRPSLSTCTLTSAASPRSEFFRQVLNLRSDTLGAPGKTSPASA